MFKHNIKLTFRHFQKNKIIFSIKVIGLSVAVACALLIGSWVLNELSFDHFHEKADQIYRLNVGNLKKDSRSAVTSGAMAPAIAPDFPEVENFVRFRQFPSLVHQGDHRFYEDRFFYTDSTLFEVFDFKLVEGQPSEVLAEPFSIVLTETAAEKYFGEKEAIGQVMKIDNQFDFQVTGVVEDPPKNAHFGFDMLASVSSLRQHPNESVRYWQLNSWYSHYYHTYFLLKENTDATAFAEKIKLIAEKYSNPEFYEMYGKEMGLYLQPLTDIHLNPIHGEIETQGRSEHVYILSLVALFILLIACSNYTNLAAALALRRNKEIGVQKVVGAERKHLANQFFTESFLISALGTSFAILLVVLVGQDSANWLGHDFDINWAFSPVIFLIFLLTGLLGGLYPAYVGASFQPASIFQKVSQKFGGLPVIKGLVVFQFIISFTLIVATLVVFQQMKFMKEQPLGMDIDQIAVLPTRGNPEVIQQFESFENELKKLPEVHSTTISELIPGEQVFGFVCRFEGMADGKNFPSNPIGYDYFKTYNIEVAAGRTFSKDFASDTLERAVINETLARELGWHDPQEAIGKKFDFGNDGENVGEVIGVVKDFHFHSLQFDIRPMLFLMDDHFYEKISLELATANLPETLTKVENTWKSFFPELPFEYFFADENFGLQYAADQRMAKLFLYFVSLAILLACMGLFGLSMLAGQKRVKEISIRKVLGASVVSIVRLLSIDFAKMVFIAILIGLPISYFLSSKWLEGFAYRMEIQWWIFLVAGIAAITVAFFTVSFQSVKAALANPSDSLRAE